ncbi:MAG: biotin/lipoyl-binding protein [Gemmataceae bacterium]|nr:biotin/lipoyl-binding protein [Gemmataceae bacterium]MDW8267243.1 biotin/lipoyl-binding protein [Gemmataceae bacterium]
MPAAPPITLSPDLERRKKVRLRLRSDLTITPTRYEGKTYHIVKDPVSLRYYRFKEQEYFLLRMMDGKHTLDETQKEFEKRFRPERLSLEDLEAFAQQLLKVGLAHNESPQAGQQLYENKRKRRRREILAALTNILYIKVPAYDPDKLLTRMLPWFRWMFTPWFFAFSVLFMLSAILLVATHFDTFLDKLPAYHEFFNFQSLAYMWFALGSVKIIHEFGHGLSCKAFGGEVHEMGLLALCLSPAMYCNVSDAWTLPNKWHRMIISFAGIYVELMIAALATFIWWNTPSQPFINNLCLSLMIVCSVSTVIFNGNPLMRFDGYYVLADWLEIPNLREKSGRFLQRLILDKCLGVEVAPEPYMAPWRRVLFVTYAIVSKVYMWVVTFSILFFMHRFLEPYKLGIISKAMTLMAVVSLFGWPLGRFIHNLHKRGRLPDMKPARVWTTCTILTLIVLFIFTVPLPVARVRETALIELKPEAVEKVFVPFPGGVLEHMPIRYGQYVEKGDILAQFRNIELENQLEEARSEYDIRTAQIAALRKQRDEAFDPLEREAINVRIQAVIGEQEQFFRKQQTLSEAFRRLVLRAPRSGVVINPPRVEEIGKLWEKDSDQPFCSIGDPSQLRALVPVPPMDYRLLKDNFHNCRRRNADLLATIRVKGQVERTWPGRVSQLPEASATEVPIQLTTRGGGPLAVKPTSRPDRLEPQSQQYLVAVDFLQADRSICPGTLAQVKIHCEWQTIAWWLWRVINATFDLGLI